MRRQHIVKVLSVLSFVRVREFADRLEVSEVTVRKDLSALEAEGKIVRTWGGARMLKDEEILLAVDLALHEMEPRRVPLDSAAGLITEGDVIYLDHDDRCVLLARMVKNMELDVITPSFKVMEELVPSLPVRVHTPGGSYSRENGTFDGVIPEHLLDSVEIDICFINISGFHQRSSKERHLIEQVLQRSKKRILLAREDEFSAKVHETLNKYRPEYLVM